MADFFLPFFGGHVLIKFGDSRRIQVAIYTVFDEESEIQVKNRKILQPGGEISEKRIQKQSNKSSCFPYILIFFAPQRGDEMDREVIYPSTV